MLSLDRTRELPPRLQTGDPEVDRVLGGGLVPGEVVLLAGEPGAGKSTLTLQLLAGVSRQGRRGVLVTAEESLAQVGLRAARIGLADASIRASASSSLQEVLELCTRGSPDVVVVDSVQTISDAALDQPPGSVVQVRECAAKLTAHAKRTETAVVLVGHVTKDGAVAGPKTLEHVVDAVLSLEGERHSSLRVLRALKNRFGSCEETGVFAMSERGLDPVADPSSLLLADRCADAAGSVVFPSLEGTRPMLVEIQALVTPSELPQPRRVALGIDGRRLAMLTGVLLNACGVELAKQDVFVSAAGGLKVREPAADLALCLALLSARRKSPLEAHTVAIGEVGLTGQIRRVPGVQRRLAEAARFGFVKAIVPRGVDAPPDDFAVVAVRHLAEATERASFARPYLESA